MTAVINPKNTRLVGDYKKFKNKFNEITILTKNKY